jgi:hypothetical protein
LIDHVVYDQIAEWEQKVQHASSGGPGAKVLSLCSASLEDLFVVLQELLIDLEVEVKDFFYSKIFLVDAVHS